MSMSTEHKTRLEFYIDKLGDVTEAIKAARAEQELEIKQMQMTRTKEAEAAYTRLKRGIK